MKVAASAGAPQRSTEILQLARQLEGVFIKQMFEEMAKTVEASSLFPEAPGRDMYEQWFRAEIADQWTEGGGTGLGRQIAQSLGARDLPAARLAAAKITRDPQAALGAAGGFASAASKSLPPLSARPSEPKPRGGHEEGARLRGQTHGHRYGHAGISSDFGPRVHPVTGRDDFHKGIDLPAPVGTRVQSPFAGVVQKVGENSLLGRYVWVEHANGYRSVFGHLETAAVEPGTRVRAGEAVGLSGNTGRSTGPHLHYGLYREEIAVDPQGFLPEPGSTLLSER